MSSGKPRGLARGGAVTILGQAISLVVSLMSVVLLSRLLPPSDFGLIAMVGVVTALGALLQDMGLGLSALKAPTLSNHQASNLFWMNVLLGFVAFGLVATSGPLLVRIYDEPRLLSITPFLALSILFGGLQAQFQVQLARGQKFGTLALISASSSLLGLVVATAGALLGFGYWSLVAQNLTNSLVGLLLKGYTSHWLPARPRRSVNTKDLALSGADLTAATAVAYMSSNAATFMIGVRMSADQVGLYSRANQLVQLPLGLIASLTNVLVPSLAQQRAQGRDPQKPLLRVQSLVAVGTTLLLALVSAIAPALFSVVLGDDWTPASSIFRILSLGGVALGLSQVSYWAFLIEGDSRELLKCDLVCKPMTTLLIILGSFISLEAVAAASSVALTLSWLISTRWLQRTAGINSRPFYANGVRTASAGVISTLISIQIATFLPSSILGQLVAPALIVVVSFGTLLGLTRSGRRDLSNAAKVAIEVFSTGREI